MKSIKIVANQPKEEISQIALYYPFKTKFEIINETVENNDSLIINIDEKIIDDDIMYDNLIKFILHLINKLYIKDLINIKVSSLLQDFIDSDIEEIENTVYDLLLDEDYFIDDKKEIYDEMKAFISKNNTLIIEGYLRFRNKSFENLIDKIIEKVIMDIQMETEYEDFIEMLRYYLSLQMAKVDIVNVVINNDRFFLYDHKNRKIENEYVKSIIADYNLDDLSKADVLVSSLIVLAPNKVIVHIKNDNEKELMQILKKIFTDRLYFCYSCNLCNTIIMNNDLE
ncbi:MAG: hypothetical protein GX231_08710 [Tissierellia bacterium]|nr:hypothetical protein [Tissierellia bacterium]